MIWCAYGLRRINKFWSCWFFFRPTEPMHLISTLSLWAEHTLSKVWGKAVDSLIYKSECSGPVKPKSKLKIKTVLAEESDITIRDVIIRILIFRANRGTWSMNFTRKSPVRRIYNTEPSPKELAWGRSTLVFPGKYSFPFCFSFSFFK